MHYCYFSKEPEVFRKVLAGVLSKVEELDFKMDSDLWCISNGENVAKIGSPVIRVRRSKVEAFKAAIGEQKAGLFPIVIVPDADNEADYMLDLGKPGESSVLKFAHGSAGPIEDVKFTIPFCGHCLCNPRETPSRLCKTCQMVLFLTTRGDIRCACTVYNRAELKCSETCEKNIWIPRTYQVLIVGSSAVGKSSLLNIISCMQQHSAVDANGEMTTIKDCANCVIDYNTHSIRYISKDELVIEESEIHGLMIVVENSTLELSYAADNLIRETISRLPRRVVKNCCIVNMFTQTETFGINEAQQQMHEFVTTFCDQHALSVLPSFICVDTVANMNQSTDNSKVCQGSFESSKRDIEKFLKTVQTIKPITPADLTVADNWKSLCAAFRPHYQKRDAEALRLMATIAKNCLTGVAIYCRKNLPLREDEWLAVVNHWSSKDKKVAAALRHLNSETR
uniref:G domain-containing protein n=1 Tax=Panagrellus redivivus TaxID=6233 RepID=A0A7E4VCA8_PANRE